MQPIQVQQIEIPEATPQEMVQQGLVLLKLNSTLTLANRSQAMDHSRWLEIEASSRECKWLHLSRYQQVAGDRLTDLCGRSRPAWIRRRICGGWLVKFGCGICEFSFRASHVEDSC
jgi:hypothetical protein